MGKVKLGDSMFFSESSGLDDDWEQDFDIEVSEEDLKLLESSKHKQLLKEMEGEVGTGIHAVKNKKNLKGKQIPI